MTTEDNGYFT